jgi:hypothetical protein
LRGSGILITAGLIFTILITFFVCKYISREPYMAREKPTWKKLVYWWGLLFASVIFNMIVYANNSYSY